MSSTGLMATTIDGRRRVAAGLVFLPRSAEQAACARRLLATSLAAYGLELDAWRKLPVGDTLTKCLYHVTVSPRLAVGDVQQRLDKARKESEERANAYGLQDFSVASLVDRDPQSAAPVVHLHQRVGARPASARPLTAAHGPVVCFAAESACRG